MEHYFNENSWIILPTKKGEDTIMSITFPNSNKYDRIIQTLINNYNGELSSCMIGIHNRMIVIKNIYILELLSNMNIKDTTTELYKEYINLYNNQHVYFESFYMI
jgi:hypothetical protein